MHCLAAVVEGPEANILAPGWYSEAIVVIELAPESRRQTRACKAHVSFIKSPSEIPGLKRVSFRTQLYAQTRTSSTLLLSDPSSRPRLNVCHTTRCASHMLRAIHLTAGVPDSRVLVPVLAHRPGMSK